MNHAENPTPRRMNEVKLAKLEIVTLTTADEPRLEEIAVLHAISWGRGFDAKGTRKRTASLKAEVQGLDPAERGIFVAGKSGVVVGFCRVIRDRGNEDHWWLAGVMVHPEHRRQGIGRARVHEAIALARARAATVLRSETHVHNELSIRFHEAVEFTNDGSFTAADGDHKTAFSYRLA